MPRRPKNTLPVKGLTLPEEEILSTIEAENRLIKAEQRQAALEAKLEAIVTPKNIPVDPVSHLMPDLTEQEIQALNTGTGISAITSNPKLLDWIIEAIARHNPNSTIRRLMLSKYGAAPDQTVLNRFRYSAHWKRIIFKKQQQIAKETGDIRLASGRMRILALQSIFNTAPDILPPNQALQVQMRALKGIREELSKPHATFFGPTAVINEASFNFLEGLQQTMLDLAKVKYLGPAPQQTQGDKNEPTNQASNAPTDGSQREISSPNQPAK